MSRTIKELLQKTEDIWPLCRTSSARFFLGTGPTFPKTKNKRHKALGFWHLEMHGSGWKRWLVKIFS